MRAAGIDLGRVRVGVALADELGLMAHPRPYLDGRNPKRLLTVLRELAQSEQIGVFVIGLPRHLDGRGGIAARRARRFAEELSRATGLPVELQDERLTTVEASGRLREQGLDTRAARERIDSAAAAVLLQSWLDARRRDP
jgi:putative Holliday junction resolvase